MARNKTIPAKQVREEIQSYQYSRGQSVMIVVGVGEDDADGVFQFDVPQQFSTVSVTGTDFEDLMSESPSWARGKPANTFRLEDLWVAVDAKRENRGIGR